jgi:O-succinylbenzoic acid--CoA ligase
MDERLSIFAAAREAGAAPALTTSTRVYTYAGLAALVQRRMELLGPQIASGRPHLVIGTNTLATFVTIHALFELGVPALLLHPRLTAYERDEQAALAAHGGALPDDACAILFTSGTTGKPRGAVLTRRALIASAEASAANLGWHDDDCWLLCMPLARIGGLSILTRSLIARRCVSLAPAFNARAFPSCLIARRITLASVVPTMLTRVFDAHPGWSPPPHLRAILVGGAAAPPKLLQRAAASRVPVVITYGSTETCSQVTATPYEARYAPAELGAGVPLPGAEIRIVETRIEVRGPMLMAGYWNEPPLARGSWLDTGDIGEIDGRGCLHVHTRQGDLIVTGGENAYPAEIERVLEAFPGISAAGVFGVPDEVWGHTVAAALVVEKSPPPDAALLEYVSRTLAPHKQPRSICYVYRLPHTAGGKLDRAALASFRPALRPLTTRASSDPEPDAEESAAKRSGAPPG